MGKPYTYIKPTKNWGFSVKKIVDRDKLPEAGDIVFWI
jgi:hypothetical protein